MEFNKGMMRERGNKLQKVRMEQNQRFEVYRQLTRAMWVLTHPCRTLKRRSKEVKDRFIDTAPVPNNTPAVLPS